MACAVPVITSNVSSLPEVVGDAGIMLAPQDVDGIAQAMEMLLTAPDVRDAFARKALVRSAGFTWESCVSQTVAAYRRVLNSA
jgi:alpha-1,3-rhamnosyl/mannosyltransferase